MTTDNRSAEEVLAEVKLWLEMTSGPLDDFKELWEVLSPDEPYRELWREEGKWE